VSESIGELPVPATGPNGQIEQHRIHAPIIARVASNDAAAPDISVRVNAEFTGTNLWFERAAARR